VLQYPFAPISRQRTERIIDQGVEPTAQDYSSSGQALRT
jgi:hypothetical protein